MTKPNLTNQATVTCFASTLEVKPDTIRIWLHVLAEAIPNLEWVPLQTIASLMTSLKRYLSLGATATAWILDTKLVSIYWNDDPTAHEFIHQNPRADYVEYGLFGSN